MSAILLQNGKQAFNDANGNPLNGGKVYFYAPNTSTPQDTWQDSLQTVLNTNPVILNARGEASIYGSGPYRQVLNDASGVLIWDQIIPDLAASLNSAVADLYSKTQVQVNTIAALRMLSKSLYSNAQTLGYYAKADGGGSTYYCDLTDTTSADNGGSIIVAADGGRWKLVQMLSWSVRQWGAKGDGIADDTAAIQAAYNAMPSNMGRLTFPRGIYNYTLLTFDSATGLRVSGDGAINATILRCTSTTATDGIKLRSTFDCTFEFIDLDHSSASFTGYLTDLGHKPSGSIDTQGMYFFRCTFTSQGYNLYSAKGVNCDKATLVTFEGCKFGSLLRPIDGQDPAGGSYSNGIRFKNCQSFDNIGYFANYLGQCWSFMDCNFQTCHDGVQRICFSDNTTIWWDLKFDNCGIYDATANGPAMLNLGTGRCLTVLGGLWGGRGDLAGGATWLNATGAVTGISVKGSVFSMFNTVAVAGVAGCFGWDLSGGNNFIPITGHPITDTVMLAGRSNAPDATFDNNSPNVSLGTLPGTSGANSIRYNQDGTIEMTGAVSGVGAGSNVPINFPTQFPTACWDVQMILQAPAGTGNVLSLSGVPANTGFTVFINGSGVSTVRWRALGK